MQKIILHMTQEFADKLYELYPCYVPFYRNFEGKDKSNGIKSTFANQVLPIKRAKGSGREIKSPLESIIFNVERAVKFGTRNRVMQTIVPKSMKDLENFEQYNEKTSAAAYHLGQIMNWSPMEIDHVLSGYLGILAQMNRALLPLEDEQRAKTIGWENRFKADSNYSTDILNRTYDARDKTKTAYARNPTGENAIKHEKWAMMTSYISNINKMANDLSADERREARGELLEIIKNWNIKFNETDRKIIDALPKDTSEGKYIVTSLPSIRLEYSANGEKYYYTMTEAEYAEYIDDYLKELDRERKQALSTSDKDPEYIAEELIKAKSEASSTVTKWYHDKHFCKFKKAG